MAIKRKDFQKTSSIILEFLLKLPDEETSSRLRDTLLHGLHFLQQYYLILQKRDKEQKPLQWTIERGLSPLTPFRETPDKFEWPWIDVESNKVRQTLPKHSLTDFILLSPIIIAVREGDLRYVKELLSAEPNLIDQVDSFGRNLLTYAVQYQQINILRYLLFECQPSANINIQANDGSTCLHRSCYTDDRQTCNIEIVRLLLQNKADVSKQDVHLRSPLHWAVLAENTDCLTTLIEYKADVHMRDADGMTPAMWACHLDRHDHFKELSRSMNGTQEKDDDGRTWIHHSVRKTEPLECLKHLLSSETMQLRDNDGRTCFHVAAEQGSVHACRLIFALNEQIDVQSYVHDGDRSRQTPLHLATKNGHARVLKELLDHGADPHLQDIHGISAFDYARNRGLYFCRSVFEVYLREQRRNSIDSQRSTGRPFNQTNNQTAMNTHDITPIPPTHGHAGFVRHNGRHSLPESLTRPTRRTNDSRHAATLSNGHKDQVDVETHRQPSQSASSRASPPTAAPPVRPRKSSSNPNKSRTNPSQFQQSHSHHRVVISEAQSGDDDGDEQGNSLDVHDYESDFDDDALPRPERPESRLSVHGPYDQIQANPSAVVLRRPHHKAARHARRHTTYDDNRYVDEQQELPSPFSKSKSHGRSAAGRKIANLSSNRVDSGSHYQTTTTRIKSSSTESIPTLDLMVAGQKVFRTKQHTETYLINALPASNVMRPPSGRLQPISSAKSTSSYTDELSSTSNKTLEDVTNNVKPSSSFPPKAHLYKKKLAPLLNSNDLRNGKLSHRSSMDPSSLTVDGVLSNRSDDIHGTANDRGENEEGDFRSSIGSGKRSKYH